MEFKGSNMMKEILYSIAALLVLLYFASSTFRYYAKFTIFVILSLISASIFIPLMLRRPMDYRNAKYPAWGGRQTSKVLGMKWEIRGTEQVPKVDDGCVVLINHQSALDLLVLAELWSVMERCTVIAKKAVFYLWPFGLAAWLWGTIYIDRQNHERARSTVNETSVAIKEKKAKILMFPEGTRHSGDALLPFKKGAFHVALSAEAPILPVVLSKYYFLDHKKKIFNGGRIILSILPPIPTKGKTVADMDSIIEEARNAMNEAFAATSKEVKMSIHNRQ
ncbi:hypothetical protein J437_LFUL002099 [Ladona fulva]|uniref:1-acyl-sn-glycerol-3-phosphate acyltransferase n=1 Tax=Ladona fulva TaxID=123851 RepID=A0A8K0JZJ3_LADFU|nr:hypothetical protein J437_LFUL002099 [Ladona fulva]